MQVFLHHDAKKYFERLSASDRNRIKSAMEGLTKEPPEGNIRPYVGKPGHFRTRVGSYRLLWRIEGSIVLVTHIEPRRQAYNKKTKKR